MTAINLALRNHYGHVVWGDSLGNEANLIYETGRIQVWGNVIRQTGRVPLPDGEPEEIELGPMEHSLPSAETPEPPSPPQPPQKPSQLRLF